MTRLKVNDIVVVRDDCSDRQHFAQFRGHVGRVVETVETYAGGVGIAWDRHAEVDRFTPYCTHSELEVIGHVQEPLTADDLTRLVDRLRNGVTGPLYDKAADTIERLSKMVFKLGDE